MRSFLSAQDERDVYEAVEDAGGYVWGRPRGTFERFSGFTRQEGFDPSLWFLAESAGGITGACLCKTAAGRGRWTWWPCGIRGGAGAWGSCYCATPLASSTAAV